MRDDSDNNYRLDAEAGLTLGSAKSRLVLGLGWYYPHS